MRFFIDAPVQGTKHYIITIHKPGAVVKHICANNITNCYNESMDLDRIAKEIIELGNICKQYYVNDVVYFVYFY